MLRGKLVGKGHGFKASGFRLRGAGEVSRIEALSDAVFGFAITLLVVSLEVPKTFGELMHAMHGFVAFAISFVLLFLVWYTQYSFFRRYGLQDSVTILLNAVLLFVILFYVYPLKFVWTLVVNQFMRVPSGVARPDGTFEPAVTSEQAPTMMIIFGAGYVAVFVVFVLLYAHAYRQRRRLELNELETFDTRGEIEQNSLNVAVGLFSICLAVYGGTRYTPLAGMSYMLLGPLLTAHGFYTGRRRRKLERRINDAGDADA
jgi:uncharacterized membrane protein